MQSKPRTSSWTGWQSSDYPAIYYRSKLTPEGRELKRSYAIEFTDADGKRRREKVDGGLKEARKALAKIQSADRRPRRTNMALAEAFDKWLEAPRRNRSLADSSKLQYRSAFKHVPSAIQRRKLSDLTEEDVLAVLARVKHLSPSTQNTVLKTISGPLRLALRKGLIGSNPAANLLPEEKPGRGSRRQYVLSPEEIASILTVCETEVELAVISLALYSGARQSELLGLRWKDVAWDKGWVRIAGQVDQQGQWTERTKSKQRTVWIPPQVGKNLKTWWLRSSFKESDDYVFPRNGARPRSQEWARQMWVRLRDTAGVSSQARFHDLRHTFASILIERGASPVELADQLGDSVQVALATYAGLFNKQASEAKLRSILEASYPG